MSRDEDKLIRQLSLVSFLLSQPRPFTSREIQESVEGYAEMSDDTFARRFFGDRAGLAEIGIEIKGITEAEMAESQLYFLPAEDFHLPRVDFTPAESRALAVALAALDGRFAYARPLRLALTAISHGKPDPIRDQLEQLPVAVAPDEDAQRAGRQLARLEDALNRGKTVCFHYPSADGSLEERTFEPYNLFLIQGRWYVVGFDHKRQAIRTFRVGRIQGIVRFRTEKVRDFSVPADYDPERYRARPPWLLGAVKGTATIKVSEGLAWWVTRLQPHVGLLGDDGEGYTRFTVPYADEIVLLSWVVGLGGCGELLEPASLRGELRRRLEDVCRAHAEVVTEEATAEGGAAARGRPPRPRLSNRVAPGEAEPIAPEHLARAIALLNYLVDERRPEVVTWRALKTDLGLTRAEVEADLQLINLVNFGGGTYALTAEATEEGVEVVRDVMADTFSQPARLSSLMARALLLALDLIGEAITLEGIESLASVRAKVFALIGEGSREGAIIVDDVLPADPRIVEVLTHAIRDRKIVVMEYFTASRDELSERQVEPYLLFRSPDGWYLEGYCLKAGHQRTFKLERVRSAHATENTFAPRPEVDLVSRQQGQAFSPDSRAHWATVRLAPHWRTYLEDRGTGWEPGPEDSLIARIPYLDESWIAREVIRFLGEAVLERPASARRRVRESAALLMSRYSRSTA